MQNQYEEKTLVQEVLSGNEKAFIKLIQQYESLVLHIVTPLIGSNADREDICQDIFIKVYENLGGFQHKSRLSTWIGNIAYNISINFLRKKKNILWSEFLADRDRKEETENEEFPASISVNSDPNPEEILIDRQELSRLQKAVERLPPLQKTILVLFHQDEQSLDEISGMLELPVNTVKSHLFRTRKLLKKILSENR